MFIPQTGVCSNSRMVRGHGRCSSVTFGKPVRGEIRRNTSQRAPKGNLTGCEKVEGQVLQVEESRNSSCHVCKRALPTWCPCLYRGEWHSSFLRLSRFLPAFSSLCLARCPPHCFAWRGALRNPSEIREGRLPTKTSERSIIFERVKGAVKWNVSSGSQRKGRDCSALFHFVYILRLSWWCVLWVYCPKRYEWRSPKCCASRAPHGHELFWYTLFLHACVTATSTYVSNASPTEFPVFQIFNVYKCFWILWRLHWHSLPLTEDTEMRNPDIFELLLSSTPSVLSRAEKVPRVEVMQHKRIMK